MFKIALTSFLILWAIGISQAMADKPVKVDILYEVPREKTPHAIGVYKSQAIDLYRIMIIGNKMEDLIKKDMSGSRHERPHYSVFIYNLKTGESEPFIRLEEPYKRGRVLAGAVADKGKRVLAINVDKRTYIVIGNKQGGVKRTFELNKQFFSIFDITLDEKGGIYILGLPKQDPREENNTTPSLFHHWNKEGEYQWSRLSDTEEEALSQICLISARCAIQIMENLIYVWISPRIHVYDASGEKQNTITLQHPDVSPPDVFFFKVLTPAHFLVQWVLGEHNPFFVLTLYDARGEVIQSDLLADIRKEKNMFAVWIRSYWEGQLFLCGSSTSMKGQSCFVAALEGISDIP